MTVPPSPALDIAVAIPPGVVLSIVTTAADTGTVMLHTAMISKPAKTRP
jgi:hypothetical protein